MDWVLAAVFVAAVFVIAMFALGRPYRSRGARNSFAVMAAVLFGIGYVLDPRPKHIIEAKDQRKAPPEIGEPPEVNG